MDLPEHPKSPRDPTAIVIEGYAPMYIDTMQDLDKFLMENPMQPSAPEIYTPRPAVTPPLPATPPPKAAVVVPMKRQHTDDGSSRKRHMYIPPPTSISLNARESITMNIPDYASMDLDSRTKHLSDMHQKALKIKHDFPLVHVPEIPNITDANHMRKLYINMKGAIDETVNITWVERFRVGLGLFFCCIELFSTKILGIDISSFAETTFKGRWFYLYDNALSELATSTSGSVVFNIPPLIRILLFTAANLGFVFMVKMLSTITGETAAKTVMTFATQLIIGSEKLASSSAMPQSANSSALPAVPDRPVTSYFGVNVSDTLNKLAAVGSNISPKTTQPPTASGATHFD